MMTPLDAYLLAGRAMLLLLASGCISSFATERAPVWISGVFAGIGIHMVFQYSTWFFARRRQRAEARRLAALWKAAETPASYDTEVTQADADRIAKMVAPEFETGDWRPVETQSR
jgi:hypothetical protein